ncbi:MAG: energy transducer TonB [Holophaga sp.]|nr:energy transducer TonB [Holophaga sp.]
MDPTYRSLSIYDLVLDPTLDPSPIANSLPPKDRLLPGAAVLVSGSLLGLMLILAPAAFTGPIEKIEKIERALPFHVDFVEISLSESPFPGLSGGGSDGNSPSPGKGFDKSITAPTEPAASFFDDSPLTPLTTDHSLVSEKALDLPFGVSNGDGRPRAMGHGNNRGVGGKGSAKGEMMQGQGFDYKLVPRVKPGATYRLKPGERGDNNTIVALLLTVEDDGTVSRAEALSGPEFLYPTMIATARLWCFEPLPLHGLKGPMKVRMRFVCQIK